MGSDNFPGSLLIRLGLGRDVVARHNPWEEMFTVAQVLVYEACMVVPPVWGWFVANFSDQKPFPKRGHVSAIQILGVMLQ